MAFEDLDAGDETRRNGDYIGFPHAETDGTALDSVSVPVGVPVTYDGTSVSEVTGDNTSSVAGVLYTYDVYGDSTHGPFVSEEDATVKTRGSVKADLTAYANGAGVTVGEPLGPNGELYVVEEIDASANHYEVLVR